MKFPLEGSVYANHSLRSYKYFPYLISRAAELTVEVLGTCTSARTGISALWGVCDDLWIVRRAVLEQSTHRSPGGYGCVCSFGHCPYKSSLIVPNSQGRMRWTFICRINLLPKEPPGEGRRVVVMVWHRGASTKVACRRQRPLLDFLRRGHSDGLPPGIAVTVLICALYQNPKPITVWSFPPLLSAPWKCGFFTILALKKLTLLRVHPSSLRDSISSFFSSPLWACLLWKPPWLSGLLSCLLTLKCHYHVLLDFFFSSKCNLKTLKKQELYPVLPRLPKN